MKYYVIDSDGSAPIEYDVKNEVVEDGYSKFYVKGDDYYLLDKKINKTYKLPASAFFSFIETALVYQVHYKNLLSDLTIVKKSNVFFFNGGKNDKE